MEHIEHPEIKWIQRTGYPSYHQEPVIYCGECGEDITDDEWYEDEHHEFLCKTCLLFFHKKDRVINW